MSVNSWKKEWEKMSVNSFSSIDVLLNSAEHASQSAEDAFFADYDNEVKEVTVDRGNVHVKTVNYIYPDGRFVTRQYNIITSRRADSVDNINIK